MAGINIPINGGVVVAAGGGAAQYCHNTTNHTVPNSSYGVVAYWRTRSSIQITEDGLDMITAMRQVMKENN